MFYLKYRPQTITELDNERIKETLGKALLNNEWGHAYLLLGTRGSGKTTTARLIAKIVNCLFRKKGEEPCNKCDSCVAIVEGRSLDVIEIDAASNTGVDDIRELRERVKLAPVSSKFKVYIIDEVHMLSNSAFNALLKTLEEPPEHVVFVLATTDPQKLPATIVSRCLVYDFGKASKQEVISSLERKVKAEKLNVEKGVLEIIAQRADGSFRDADKFLEQMTMQGKDLTLDLVKNASGSAGINLVAKDILFSLKDKDSKKTLLIIEKFALENGSVKLLILELINYLKSLLLLRNGIESEYEDISFADQEILGLISKLIEVSAMVSDCPVAQLPLEIVVVEFCSKGPQIVKVKQSEILKPEKLETTKVIAEEVEVVEKAPEVVKNIGTFDPSVDVIVAKWTDVLNGVKPFNHNLSALLRSSRPKKLEKDFLTIEAFYKFHMDKLSETKNREIVEKVVSDIIGTNIKIKFVLSDGKQIN